MRADGTAFYYSDFTMSAHKEYGHDRWSCCSGTLPQVAADYGISSYFAGVIAPGAASAETAGITVNLYVPSRVAWQHEGSPVSLTQQTTYPAAATSELVFAMQKDAAFPLALRIPAWSKQTRVRVNGKETENLPEPGTWHIMRRSWRNGDRVLVEFDMPLRTESLIVAAVRSGTVPSQPSAPLAQTELGAASPEANVVAGRTRLAALLRGPVVMMATGAWPIEVDESALLRAEVATSGDRVTVHHATGPVIHRPYTAIESETYRTYQPLRQS